VPATSPDQPRHQARKTPEDDFVAKPDALKPVRLEMTVDQRPQTFKLIQFTRRASPRKSPRQAERRPELSQESAEISICAALRSADACFAE